MKNLVILSLIVSLSLLFSHNAQASFQADVTSCLKISNSDDRLDCYDTVVKYYKLNPSASKAAGKTTTNVSALKSSPASPIPNSTPDAATLAPKQNTVPSFGQSEASTEEAVESIRSRIIGEFSGWEKGMILELENGQKWKVTGTGRGYKKMDNPIITISRGFFGSFNANVEGLNSGAKVKRVK